MVILGIDPGLAHTGWGIIEERRGEVRCRAYGCIETSAGSPLAVRLSHIARDLKDVVERYRPDTAAIESIYFGANVRSAIPTAHARGAALVALSECALEIGEYTPMQIKQAVVGTGAHHSLLNLHGRVLANLERALRKCHKSGAAGMCRGDGRTNVSAKVDALDSRRVGAVPLDDVLKVAGNVRQAHRERASGTGLNTTVGTTANLAAPFLDNPPTRMGQTGVDTQDDQASLPSPFAKRKARPRASFTNVCSRITQRGQDA